MLADWYRKQRRKEAFEKGRAEGFAEGRAEGDEIWLEWLKRWEEWHQRRTDAVLGRAPFTEPRPKPSREVPVATVTPKRTGGE